MPVRKRLSTAPVEARPGSDWQEAFLRLLAVHGNVSAAAKEVGHARSHVYEARALDPAFAARWDEARETAIDSLEGEAMRRALERSDTLLIFLLKGNRPERYQERLRTEHTGPNGAPLEYKLNLAALSDEELASLERIHAKMAKPS